MLTFQGPRVLIQSIAISPDGRFLAVGGGSDGEVCIWDLREPGTAPIALKAGIGGITDMGFLQDGRLVACKRMTGFRVVDPATGKSHDVDDAWSAGHRGVMLLPADQVLLVFEHHLELRQIEATGSTLIRQIPVPPSTGWLQAGLRADGKLLAMGIVSHAGGNAIHVTDETGELIHEIPCKSTHIDVLEWSPCGRFLAGVFSLKLVVWDAETGTQLAELRAGGTRLFRGPRFHPSGRFLAAGGANIDGGVYCWDTTTWTEIIGYRWPVGPVTRVIFSSDGALAAAAGEKGQVTVWDVDL